MIVGPLLCKIKLPVVVNWSYINKAELNYCKHLKSDFLRCHQLQKVFIWKNKVNDEDKHR